MPLSKGKLVSLTASPSVKRKAVQPTSLTSTALDNNYDGSHTSEEDVISKSIKRKPSTNY